MNLFIMRKMRQQHTIKQRLAEAQMRQGLFLPTKIPVSLESLQQIKDQLAEALERQMLPPPPGYKGH